MERKDFFKGLGVASVASLLPFDTAFAEGEETIQVLDTCIIMPDEEEGPFPYPGGEITNPLNRIDVRDGQTGVQLGLTLTLVNTAACTPIAGARIDIWHCNKDGWYSGYDNQSGGVSSTSNDHASETWLRGYQTTDANGQAKFTTVYPGWYQGRATHIHLEIFINGVLQAKGQMAFPEATSNTVHTSSLYAAHGTNTTSNANDGVFGQIGQNSSGTAATDTANETLVLTGNITDGFAGTLTVALNHEVATEIVENKPVTKNIAIFPNPASKQLILSHPVAEAGTTVKVVNLEGKVIAAGKLQAGATTTSIDISKLAAGVYVLVVETRGEKQAVKFVKN